jgi:hypothetical protein
MPACSVYRPARLLFTSWLANISRTPALCIHVNVNDTSIFYHREPKGRGVKRPLRPHCARTCVNLSTYHLFTYHLMQIQILIHAKREMSRIPWNDLFTYSLIRPLCAGMLIFKYLSVQINYFYLLLF